jgi:hypothetical protein
VKTYKIILFVAAFALGCAAFGHYISMLHIGCAAAPPA